MAADHRKSLNGLVGGSRLAPTLLFIASLAFGLIEPTGKATAQPSQNEIRASSWTFGHKLSLAVSANFLFGVEQSEKYFNEAQAIGRELGVQVKPLAPKPQSIADGLLKLIEYFTDGDGADIRSLILSRHGDYNAALYTFAVRISQLPVLYRVNPEMGDKIAEFVRVNSTKIRLPEHLWKPSVEAVAKRASTDDVNSAVYQMVKDVAQYLTKGAAEADELEALNQEVARLYQAGRYAEAIGVARRALAAVERQFGPDHAYVGASVYNLAELYRYQGRYAEAEPLHLRALALIEKALGPDHPDVGRSLSNLAELYRAQGRYAEAEPLYQRALAVTEKALGPDHPNVGIALNNLALLYRAQGRYAEAEPFYRRALALTEKALGADHLFVGRNLNNLADLYRAQGRYSEAEPLYRRALALTEKTLGPDHPDVGIILNNLAELYKDQGRYAESEPLYRRALAISEQALGLDHPNVGASLNNLAALYHAQDRYAEAEPLLRRALELREKTLGLGHPDVGQSLNNLARLYHTQGRYAEAEPLLRRALALYEKPLGPDHPDVGQILNNLAGLYFEQRDWARAADFWRRSTRIIAGRAERGTLDLGQAPTGKKKSEAEQLSWQFWGLVKVAHRLAAKGGSANATSRQMFETAQWAQASEAAQSVALMAARGAKGDATLASLARERQDLVVEWQKRDAVRTAAVAQAPDERNRQGEAVNAARLAAIDARIAEIDRRLKVDFSDYAALVSPSPLSVEAVQAVLRAGEALVLFLDTPELKPTPEETFIWVVTKTNSRWVRIELGSRALTERVQALRGGLDRNAAARTAVQIGGPSPTTQGFLPFDLAVAHELYEALFGQIEEMIEGKHLLIVPSGPLTSLPFHVLVTKKPKQAVPDTVEGYAAAAWLAKRNAITVLPSVASLAALRRHGGGDRAPDPYLGFGNPRLLGASGADRRAWSVQACTDAAKRIEVAALSASKQRGVSEFFRGSTANVAAVRSLAPLPETAAELCEVGQRLGADVKNILLGSAATETAIKAMSADGRLARARVVHFATHGLIAGELKGLAEPALVLTPPADGTEASGLEQDDGLLTASEVAALKLNADWVVLSACNTAAGEGNAEALSGLARAFFYAGARALLVSHWPVNSGAAVKLTTRAFTALEQHPGIGRAEALRRAMLETIAEGGPQAHPSYWAPFVVVGEGARL